MIKPLLPKTAWLIPILLFSAAYAHAQDSTAYKYSQDSSIKMTVVPQGKYSSILYTANGRVLTNQEIITRIQLYDASASEYQKYRNSRVGMLVWGGVAIGSAIGAGIASNQQSDQGARYTLAGIAISALIMELVTGITGSRHFDLSIQRYNEHFLH